MRRTIVFAIACLVLVSVVPAHAKVVAISAAPNPASVGDRVRQRVDLGVGARLEVWVSAAGFHQPSPGTMPPGAWSHECCPSQTGGTPAWHFRSTSAVAPGPYRFGAVARARGRFVSSAFAGASLASVWISIR